MSQKNNEYLPLTEAVYYILLSVQSPNHGYGIMQFVKEISNERVNLGPGTLYGAIKTLQEKNWIKLVDADQSTRKKEYIITELGRNIVKNEIERLNELVENGINIMNGGIKNDDSKI